MAGEIGSTELPAPARSVAAQQERALHGADEQQNVSLSDRGMPDGCHTSPLEIETQGHAMVAMDTMEWSGSVDCS